MAGPVITYPGITGVVSLDGTASIGITPCSFGLTCFYDSAPAITGDLVIGDGSHSNITIHNCKRDYQEQVTSGNSDYLIVRLLDRRWTWREGFPVDGHYNQVATSKKYVPWRVASLYQMARILLDKMGEYPLNTTLPANTIDLPGGLAAPPVFGVMPELNPGYSWAISAASWAAGVASITTSIQHGFNIGDQVIISGVTPSGYNGTFIVTTVISPTVFRYALAGAPGAYVSGGSAATPVLDRVIDPAGEYLALGQNLPASRTNPTELWESRPAAIALANMVEPFGRAVVLNLIDNKVRIVRLGSGIPLPSGGVWVSNGVSVTGDSIPDRILVRGAPTRFNLRLACREVNREWDGSWVSPERVSYAPARAGQTMLVWILGSYNASWAYVLVLNGVTFTVAAGSQPTFALVLTQFVTLISASTDPRIAGKLTASSAVTYLVLTAVAVGYEFEVLLTGSTAPLKTGASSWFAPTYGWYSVCQVGPISGPRNQQQSNTVTLGTYVFGDIWTVTIGGHAFTTTGTAPTAADAYFDLCTQINTYSMSGGSMTANSNAGELLVTGITPGTSITVTAGTTGAGPAVVTLVSGTTFTPKGFEKCGQRIGVNARSTTHLTQKQAAALAEYSVRRCYQIITVNPADPTDSTIPTPGYSITDPISGLPVPITSIDNRYRIIPQGSRPIPVEPLPGDASVKDGSTGIAYAAEQYRGFSTDRQNIAYGSVWTHVLTGRGLMWTEGDYLKNTKKRGYLPIPFQFVDVERGVTQFEVPVFRILGLNIDGGVKGVAMLPSDIVIEIGCQILDDPSGIPSRSTYVYDVGGFAPTIERVFPDIQLEVIGQYDANHVVTGSFVLDQDPINRSKYYAEAIGAALQLPDGIGRRYEGTLSIPNDGLVRQVQWQIDANGCFTVASSNSEFSHNIPTYQQRRYKENVEVDPMRAAQNLWSDFRLRGETANAIHRVIGNLIGLGGGFK